MVWLQAAVLTLAAVGGKDVELLDFYADWCGPCRQMAPTVDELAVRGYPIRKINVDRDRATADRFRVQALPCYILVVGGREVDRVEGPTSYGRLLQMFKTAAADGAKSDAPATPKVPPRMPLAPPGAAMPAVASGPVFISDPPTGLQEVASAGPGDNPLPAGWKPAAPARPAQTTGSVPASNAELIAATVRLRIEDAKGNSCGTGTIIDARQGWALILTCGHIFRDSQGKGRIEVDLFGGGPRRVEGELISYDMDRDVGLLKIRVPGPVAVTRVAPAGLQLAEGDPVVSVGCNNGNDPTAQPTRIRSRDQFAGPPNVEADGLPVEGRSGGGLFTPDGLVVGVCNCADPTENQGMYAALASIHKQLDESGLSYVYQSTGNTPSGGENAAGPRPDAVAATPTMPRHMPGATDAGGRVDAPLRPTAARSVSEPANRWQGLTAEERAALEEIERRKAAGCEVICIVRSRADPKSKSEIVVLDKASPEFLRQLAAQAEAGPATPDRVSVQNPQNGRAAGSTPIYR
jgi:thiol-disulfide isomerase/thioredoxin